MKNLVICGGGGGGFEIMGSRETNGIYLEANGIFWRNTLSRMKI
jgi:hypothetical protein